MRHISILLFAAAIGADAVLHEQGCEQTTTPSACVRNASCSWRGTACLENRARLAPRAVTEDGIIFLDGAPYGGCAGTEKALACLENARVTRDGSFLTIITNNSTCPITAFGLQVSYVSTHAFYGSPPTAAAGEPAVFDYVTLEGAINCPTRFGKVDVRLTPAFSTSGELCHATYRVSSGSVLGRRPNQEYHPAPCPECQTCEVCASPTACPSSADTSRQIVDSGSGGGIGGADSAEKSGMGTGEIVAIAVGTTTAFFSMGVALVLWRLKRNGRRSAAATAASGGEDFQHISPPPPIELESDPFGGGSSPTDENK